MKYYVLKYPDGNYLGFCPKTGKANPTKNINKIHFWENTVEPSRYVRYINRDFAICEIEIDL